MAENRYDFNDFIEQMDQMRNMGPLDDLLKMIAGVGNIPGMDEFEMDEKELDYMKAIVMSMTPAEREDPDLLNQSRRRRVAEGSARALNEVNRLIKQFKQSREMMAGMCGGKMPKGLGQMIGGKQGFGGGGNPLQGLGGGAPKSNRTRKNRNKIQRK